MIEFANGGWIILTHNRTIETGDRCFITWRNPRNQTGSWEGSFEDFTIDGETLSNTIAYKLQEGDIIVDGYWEFNAVHMRTSGTPFTVYSEPFGEQILDGKTQVSAE